MPLHSLFIVAVIAGFILLAGCVSSPDPSTNSYRLQQDVVYAVHNGQPLAADLYIPAGAGPFPGVLVIHGGGWYKGKKEDMNKIAEMLAERNFTVANISYRLAPDYIFPAQIYDSKAAVRWLRRNAQDFKLDPQRIGAFGYSAGAHLALLLAYTDPEDGLEGDSGDYPTSSAVQAVVAGGSPVDLAAFNDNETLRKFLGGNKTERPERYRQASPIQYVDSSDPPTYLYHGRFDWVVDPQQTQDLLAALRQANVPVEFSESALGHVATFLFDDDEIMAGIHFLQQALE